MHHLLLVWSLMPYPVQKLPNYPTFCQKKASHLLCHFCQAVNSYFFPLIMHTSVVCQNLSSAFVVCQNLSSAFTCTSLHKNPPTTSHITTQIMLYFALISMLYSSSSRLLTDSSHLHTVSLLNLVEEERLPCAPASYACS